MSAPTPPPHYRQILLGEIMLLVCRACGAVIADAETHDKVDCCRPLNNGVEVIR